MMKYFYIFLFLYCSLSSAQDQSDILSSTFEFDSITIEFKQPKDWVFIKERDFFYHEDKTKRIYVRSVYNKAVTTKQKAKEIVEDMNQDYYKPFYFEIDGFPCIKSVYFVEKMFFKGRMKRSEQMEVNVIFFESNSIYVGYLLDSDLSEKEMKKMQQKMSPIFDKFVKSFSIARKNLKN